MAKLGLRYDGSRFAGNVLVGAVRGTPRCGENQIGADSDVTPASRALHYSSPASSSSLEIRSTAWLRTVREDRCWSFGLKVTREGPRSQSGVEQAESGMSEASASPRA